MFTDWLLSQLQKKDWSQADLARATGLTTAAISKYINGRTPDTDALLKIARAMKLPPAQVFRAAGLLPPVNARIETVEELDEIMRTANDDERAEILRYARYILRDRKITNPKTAET